MKSIKLKKTSLFLFSFLLVSSGFNNFFSQGEDDLNQNLVLNGSFEELVKKEPKKLGEITKCKEWTSFSKIKSDLYRSTLKNNELISTQKNSYGKEDPQDGESYAGIITYQKKGGRSYLAVPLSTRLKKDKEYYVEFYISLAEASKYAVDNIGMIISRPIKPDMDKDNAFIQNDKNSYVTHLEKKVVKSFNGWEKICGTFVAKGKEELIIIGNFFPNNNLKIESVKKPKTFRITVQPLSYYYVDNVVLREYFKDEDAFRIAKNIPSEDWNELSPEEKGFEPCECVSELVKEDEHSTMIHTKEVIIDDEMTLKQEIEAYEIYFGFGSNEIPEESKYNLREVVKLLKANPSLKVTVVGNSDVVEDEAAKTTLTYADMDKKRAKAVYEELVSFGISASRISKSYKGNSVRSKDFYDEEGWDTDPEEVELNSAKNRRVEFLVL